MSSSTDWWFLHPVEDHVANESENDSIGDDEDMIVVDPSTFRSVGRQRRQLHAPDSSTTIQIHRAKIFSTLINPIYLF